MQTTPLLSRPCDKAMASFRSEWWPLVDFYVGVFDCIKGTSLECAESIYVKITETACVSDEFCYLKKEVGQIVHEFRQFVYVYRTV